MPRLWVPRRVLVTPAALAWEHGRAITALAAALGSEVVELRPGRLPSRAGDDPRRAYEAKSTLYRRQARPAVAAEPGERVRLTSRLPRKEPMPGSRP